MYDIIIIGAGPAGMSAAVYCARKKFNTLIISKDIGGQTAWSSEVDNYLGFHLMKGADLVKEFHEHIESFENITHEHGGEVIKAEKSDNGFKITIKGGKTFEGRALIITSGKIPRHLNVSGEDKLIGRGVTYCATCDAPLFKNKDVVVVGGGNSAMDAVLQLTKIANKIYSVNIDPAFQGDEIMKAKIKKSDKVELIAGAETMEILGDKLVSGIKIKNKKTGKAKSLKAQGIFIEIGSIPSIDYVRNLVKLNEKDEIVIDKRNMTSSPGIFAAGDVTDVIEKQTVIAAGEGAKAAIQAGEYLVRAVD